MAVDVARRADAAAGRNEPQQWVYLADDAPAADKDLLGGKGAGLAAMTQAGLPCPPAFTITTEACNAYQDAGGAVPGWPVGADAGGACADRAEVRAHASATPATRCWSRCARAPSSRCRA